jgi:hypothetical protein
MRSLLARALIAEYWWNALTDETCWELAGFKHTKPTTSDAATTGSKGSDGSNALSLLSSYGEASDSE